MSESEELVVSRKTWSRSMDAIEKDGFREGFEAGREKSFQNGFDIGYKNGFQLYFEKALQDTKMQMMEKLFVTYEHPEDKCVICSEENTDEVMQLPLETIIKKQKHQFSENKDRCGA